MMDIQEALKSRRSIRSYTKEQVSDEQLGKILESANSSPVAGAKYEMMHITVIRSPEALAKIEGLFSFYGAQTLIIISGKKDFDRDALCVNAGCMLENMQLSAHGLGIGSVIIWAVNKILPGHPEVITIPEGFTPLAGLAVGHESVMCGRTSGSLREVLEQGIIILAVRWENIPDVMREVQDWHGKILIDATNQLTYSDDGSPVRVELDVTGSEYVAGLATNARVVKAFGSMFSQYMDGITEDGRRVLFYAGDDTDAKREVYPLFCDMGFFPVDLGSLAEGGRLLQVGGALSGKHFVKRSDDLCL